MGQGVLLMLSALHTTISQRTYIFCLCAKIISKYNFFVEMKKKKKPTKYNQFEEILQIDYVLTCKIVYETIASPLFILQ